MEFVSEGGRTRSRRWDVAGKKTLNNSRYIPVEHIGFIFAYVCFFCVYLFVYIFHLSVWVPPAAAAVDWTPAAAAAADLVSRF